MRSQIAQRLRSSSLSNTPPAPTSTDYSTPLANLATHILYRSPLPSQNDLPIFILNAAAFPDARDTDFDALLPYVISRLPDDEELIGGRGYEIVFFAGGGGNGATTTKKGRPGWGWFLQAYHVLTRATRKRLQKLYFVHEKNWIRLFVEMFSTAVSPKFRKKVVHVSTLTGLALHIPIEDLLIPPTAYMTDRRLSSVIHAPYAIGRRAFGVKQPLPVSKSGTVRLPRVLREATSFVLMDTMIKSEGIFRISARAMTVDILREAYDRGQKFIVWREGDVALTHSHHKEGFGDVSVGGLEQMEGYELHTAAGLIKQWYKDLRDPIFPQSCYTALERIYDINEVTLDASHILQMLSMETDYSPISKISRTILTMHLLPLLSRVVEYSQWNQMTPYNLAVCFAPILLCGTDPIQDFKITTIIRRILEAMVMHWKVDVAHHFGVDSERFEATLRTPIVIEDREDPLQEAPGVRVSEEDQIIGITLLDNDDSDEEVEDSRPPLPPRPPLSTTENDQSEVMTGMRRKPAPPLQQLPRYSMVVTERPATLYQAPFHNTVPSEEEEVGGFTDSPSMLESNLEDLPEYEATPTPAVLAHTPFYNSVPNEEEVLDLHDVQVPPEYEAASSPATLILRKPLPKADSRP